MFTKNTIANFEGNGKARFYGLFLGEVDTIDILFIMDPTVCVIRWRAGVDSAWEQDSAWAWKMLENAAESRQSGARRVGRHN